MLKQPDPTDAELQEMPDDELHLELLRFESEVENIESQIEAWENGSAPSHWGEEWRKKAAGALSWKKSRLAAANLESERRRILLGKNPPVIARELPLTPQSSFREVPHSSQGLSKESAFVRAAREYLDPQEFGEIWSIAESDYREVFKEDMRPDVG